MDILKGIVLLGANLCRYFFFCFFYIFDARWMFFCRNKGQLHMFLVVCQISIKNINVSGRVSSLALPGEDTCFTNTGYEATCWLDSVASEVFRIKVRFNFVWGVLCFGVCLFWVCFFSYECDFIALLICCFLIFALQEDSIPHCTLKKAKLSVMLAWCCSDLKLLPLSSFSHQVTGAGRSKKYDCNKLSTHNLGRMAIFKNL